MIRLSSREALPSCVKGLAISETKVAIWTTLCHHTEFWAEEKRRAMLNYIPQTSHLIRRGPRSNGSRWHGLPLGLRNTDAEIVYAGEDAEQAKLIWEEVERQTHKQ